MKITNRRAKYDYRILETLEVGIQLTGPEVKSVKSGRMKLEGSFAKLIGSELFLVNAVIAPYRFARQQNYNPKRTRKLLLHRKEITALQSKKRGASLTLVPLACYTTRGLVKLQIALAKGKKGYEKRKLKQKRAVLRQIEREILTKGM